MVAMQYKFYLFPKLSSKVTFLELDIESELFLYWCFKIKTHTSLSEIFRKEIYEPFWGNWQLHYVYLVIVKFVYKIQQMNTQANN